MLLVDECESGAGTDRVLAYTSLSSNAAVSPAPRKLLPSGEGDTLAEMATTVLEVV
jgi:hypothetical protein